MWILVLILIGPGSPNPVQVGPFVSQSRCEVAKQILKEDLGYFARLTCVQQ